VTTAPAPAPAALARARTFTDRVLAAFPVAALALAVFVFYAVEAWTRKTPWIFTDELEWSQISRSIASTGHAARRGQPVFFKSIYAFLIAPFWWIHSTASAYAAIKYANALIMTLAAVPTYLLARMLVSRRGAIVAALLSVSIPAMSYATTIIVEVLAYPYYALCSWLSVRAYRSARQRDIVIAALAAAGGLLVRSPQFLTIPVAFVIGGVGLLVTGPWGRQIRRNWSRSDTLGAIVLAIGALFLFNRVVLQHIHQWQYASEYTKNRMIDLGLRAGLGLTMGLGVLPVIGGLASLRLPERRGEPAYRAFAAWLGATFVCLALYTADKAAYLSTIFATLWEERDLIYLSPLLIIGTVLVFESRRLDWRAVAAASAFVLLLVTEKAFQTGWPYFEAPGFAIPAILTKYESWGVHDLRLGSLCVVGVSLALLAGRRYTAVRALALLVGLAWLLSGEIANTVGMDKEASLLVSNLPKPLDWVDISDHGAAATYLGQDIADPNGELLDEFWNRSIAHVDSLDGSASGPGPTYRPLVESGNGRLSGISSHYVLADDGVTLDAKTVARRGVLVLYYSPSGAWRLLDNYEQRYSDGWCPAFCAYTYFKAHQRGTLEVTLSRTAFNGKAPAGRARIDVGTVGITSENIPYIRQVLHQRFALIRNHAQTTLYFSVPATPVRVEVNIAPRSLIPPYSSGSDPRALGAQVGVVFVPDRSAAAA